MSEEMAVYQRGWTAEEKSLIKRTIAKDADDDELALFLIQCQRTGLDPFSGQIRAIKRYDSREGRKVMSIQTGIDGFRIIAERTKRYAGQLGPYWCGEDGVWMDVWLKKEPPAAAKVGAIHDDFKEPVWGIALWDEYKQTYKDKSSGQMLLTPFWQKMPALMLAKCAEAIALRKAFPGELSSLYTHDEMMQADNVVDAQVVSVTTAIPETTQPPPPTTTPAENDVGDLLGEPLGFGKHKDETWGVLTDTEDGIDYLEFLAEGKEGEEPSKNTRKARAVLAWHASQGGTSPEHDTPPQRADAPHPQSGDAGKMTNAQFETIQRIIERKKIDEPTLNSYMLQVGKTAQHWYDGDVLHDEARHLIRVMGQGGQENGV